MERGFKYLEDKYSLAGAREIFEQVCVELFQAEYGPRAKSVDSSGGDGGIDILIGELPDADKIYQCKFFLDRIEASQKQQIKKSFETAIKKYSIKEWNLCLPSVLNQKELIWWSKWKSEKEKENNIEINLFDGSNLISKLKRYNLYNELFDEDIRGSLNTILTELTEQRQKIHNEILYGPEDLEDIEEEYNDFTFIKMLESANITELNMCKSEYFNTEIAKQESMSKDEITGLEIYNNLKLKVLSIWGTQYRMHKHPSDGNELLNFTYLRIEDLDMNTLFTTNEYNLLAKKGILHHLANEERIGWIENYLEKLAEYMGESE